MVAALSTVSLALAIPAVSTAAPRPCNNKSFTIDMFRRAAITAYAGIRIPSSLDRAHLQRFLRCARRPGDKPVDHQIWSRSIKANYLRRNPPMETTEVSWYSDAGATASGEHYTYGFAACGDGLCVPMGTQIEFCRPAGHCIVGTRDDSGPYIGGRGFDLNQDLAAYLGIQSVGVGEVSYRVMR